MVGLPWVRAEVMTPPTAAVRLAWDGHEIKSTSAEATWATPLGPEEVGQLTGATSWAALREVDPLRARLGHALFGHALGEVIDRGSAEVALRLFYSFDALSDADSSLRAVLRALPWESALIKLDPGAALVELADAGVVLVQGDRSGSVEEEAGEVADFTLPADVQVLLLSGSVPAHTPGHIDPQPLARALWESLTPLGRTAHGIRPPVDGRGAHPAQRTINDHAPYPALQVLAHGEPGSAFLEDRRGRPERVVARSFGRMCRRWNVDFAVIACCYSANGLAQEIRRDRGSARGARVVVAFRGPVTLHGATDVCRRLWTRLADGGASLDEVILQLRQGALERERAAAVRPSAAARRLPSMYASLVVLHHLEGQVRPFAAAWRQGRAGLTATTLTQMRGRVIDVGEPVRLDSASVLDRRPGAVVLVDRTSTEARALRQELQEAEDTIAGWAKTLGCPLEARDWREGVADQPANGGTSPFLVIVPDGTAPDLIRRHWAEALVSGRVVFRLAGSMAHREALGLATTLEDVARDVVCLERHTELPTERRLPEVWDLRVPLDDLEGVDDTEDAWERCCGWSLDQADERAILAAARTTGALRRCWEPVFCATDRTARCWLHGMRYLPDAPVPVPRAREPRWAHVVQQARASLTVAAVLAHRQREPWPWLEGADREVRRLAEPSYASGPTASEITRSRSLASLTVRSRTHRPWDAVPLEATPGPGFDVLARALEPAAGAIELLIDGRLWGWTMDPCGGSRRPSGGESDA